MFNVDNYCFKLSVSCFNVDTYCFTVIARVLDVVNDLIVYTQSKRENWEHFRILLTWTKDGHD